MTRVHKEGDPECMRRDRFREMVRKRETSRKAPGRIVDAVAEWPLATRALSPPGVRRTSLGFPTEIVE